MTWLTCVKPWDHGTNGKDWGVSADQFAARHVGQDTRLPSLELTTALGGARIAWRTPTQSLPQEGNPRAVFQKLFGYPREKATTLMLDVHHRGRAVVSEGPREKCEFDVARLHAHGLWATMQKDR